MSCRVCPLQTTYIGSAASSCSCSQLWSSSTPCSWMQVSTGSPWWMTSQTRCPLRSSPASWCRCTSRESTSCFSAFPGRPPWSRCSSSVTRCSCSSSSRHPACIGSRIWEDCAECWSTQPHWHSLFASWGAFTMRRGCYLSRRTRLRTRCLSSCSWVRVSSCSAMSAPVST